MSQAVPAAPAAPEVPQIPAIPVQPEVEPEKPVAETPAPVADAAPVDPAKPETPAAPAEKTGDEPKVEPSKEAPVVPEKYDLKLPQGSLLDQSRIDKIAATARERGLSNEQAQAMIESENSAVSEFVQSTAPGGKLWTKQIDKWEAEALADPEIGGSPEKFAESKAIAKKAFDKYAPEESKAFLNQTALGSHPALIKLFKRIGSAMKNDQTAHGQANPVSAKPKSFEEVMYKNTVNQNE
jgi:hypothetical protein